MPAMPRADAQPAGLRALSLRRLAQATGWLGRRPLILALAIITLLSVAFLSQTALLFDGKLYFSLADDAMISMTYARNLAHGAGLVWTPGEAPVEGFTNPLWTVWLAFMHLISPVDRWAPLLGALSGLAALMAGLAAAARIASRLGLSPYGRAFALLSAATLYAPIFWSLRGFEVGALIAIQGWMLALVLDREDAGVRKHVLLGLLAAAAFLTRMDSLVITAAILAVQLIDFPRLNLKRLAIAPAILALGAGLLFAARGLYYGELLPNTAYLKLESVSLVERLRGGLAADLRSALRWAPLLILAGLAAVLPFKAWAQRKALLGVLGVIVIQFAYAAYIGGDAWEWSKFPDRFLALVAFPLCVAAGYGFDTLLARFPLGRGRAAALTTAAALVAFGWTSLGDWANTMGGKGFQFAEEKYLIEAGLTLKASTPPGFSYGVTWAGTIPYYAEGRRPVDLLGKMDKVIAHSRPEPGQFKPGHNKYDLDYSLGKLRPDAMLQPPEDIPTLPGMAEKIRDWGYVTTPGGWWILRDSVPRLTNRRVLDVRFWWDSLLPSSLMASSADDGDLSALGLAPEAAGEPIASPDPSPETKAAASRRKVAVSRTVADAPSRAKPSR